MNGLETLLRSHTSSYLFPGSYRPSQVEAVGRNSPGADGPLPPRRGSPDPSPWLLAYRAKALPLTLRSLLRDEVEHLAAPQHIKEHQRAREVEAGAPPLGVLMEEGLTWESWKSPAGPPRPEERRPTDGWCPSTTPQCGGSPVNATMACSEEPELQKISIQLF